MAAAERLEKAQRFAKAEARRLAEEWGISENMDPPVFRNRNSSECKFRRNSNGGLNWQLIFGWQQVERILDEGYSEYSSLRYLMVDEAPKGLIAVQHLVLHEFAHALTVSLYGGKTRPHGLEFQATYRELLKSENLL